VTTTEVDDSEMVVVKQGHLAVAVLEVEERLPSADRQLHHSVALRPPIHSAVLPQAGRPLEGQVQAVLVVEGAACSEGPNLKQVADYLVANQAQQLLVDYLDHLKQAQA
jgi:hypothetical protein